MPKRGGASSASFCESRFETPEAVFLGANPFRAQFGGKLRRIFELPAAHTEPENIRILIRQIELKLDGKR